MVNLTNKFFELLKEKMRNEIEDNARQTGLGGCGGAEDDHRRCGDADTVVTGVCDHSADKGVLN